MPRKKKSESPEINADGATAPEAAHEQSPDTDSSAPDAAQEFLPGEFLEGAQVIGANYADDTSKPADDKKQFRPVRDTFVSTLAGVRAGEDKRFKAPQVFVDFADDQRATDDEKTELRKSGFRYRPSDKGYSALATPETRQARDELAQKFTDRRLKEKAKADEGQER